MSGSENAADVMVAGEEDDAGLSFAGCVPEGLSGM